MYNETKLIERFGGFSSYLEHCFFPKKDFSVCCKYRCTVYVMLAFELENMIV